MQNEVALKTMAWEKAKIIYGSNLGYGELREMMYSIVSGAYEAGYERGVEDKENTMKRIKDSQDMLLSKKFNEVLDYIYDIRSNIDEQTGL